MQLKRRKKRAGLRAAAKYREMRRAWLRRTRRHWLLVALAASGIIVLANLALIWLPSKWNWTAGGVTGVLLALFVAAREEPPAYVEQWRTGSWCEEFTEKALRPLEAEGWRVHHDLAARRGNFDHVVVGPGGVFLLDTKRMDGEVTVTGDVAVVRRLEDPELSYHFDAGKKIIPLALEVKDRLKAATRATQYVQAVVVVWGRFPADVAGDRCTYVHGDRLATWLREQPVRVAPERVEQFSAALQRDVA